MRGVTGKLIWVGVALAAFCWLLDSLLYTSFSGDRSFLIHLCRPQPQELWPRVAAVVILILFGCISHVLYARSQRALSESELKLRAQYRAIPIPTLTWQKRGDDLSLVDYNDAADEFTRGGLREYLGIKATDMYRDSPEIVNELERCIKEHVVSEREIKYRMRTTGEEKRLAVKYAFVPPDSVLIHAEDVTELAAADEERQELQDRWISFAENAPGIIAIVDREGVIKFLNRTLRADRKEDILGCSIYDLINEDYREAAREAIEHTFVTGETTSYEAQILPGEPDMWFSTQVGSIKREGKTTLATIIATDITERKLAEQALKATHEFLELAVEARTAELATMLEVSNSIASTHELQPSLLSILQGLKRIVSFDAACIHTLQGNFLFPQSFLGPDEQGFELSPLPVSQFWNSQEILHRRQTLIVPDVRSNAYGEQVLIGSILPERHHGHIRSLVAAPVTAGRSVIGMLSVVDAEENRYTGKEVQMVAAFADLAALALERDIYFKQSEQLAVVAERERLARDLHDAVTQTLFSINMMADALPRIYERDPEEGERTLEQMSQLTRSALAEMRTLLLELRPTSLADADTGELLGQLVESLTGRSQLPISVDIEGECSHAPEIKVAVYRVAQEALNNVVKHARASHASVTLQDRPHAIELCISDDGRGFNPLAVPPEKLGLAIMRDRAEAIGAKLTIDSQDGRGTTVTLLWEAKQE